MNDPHASCGVGSELTKYSSGLLKPKFDTKLLGPEKPVDCFLVGHLHGMVGIQCLWTKYAIRAALGQHVSKKCAKFGAQFTALHNGINQAMFEHELSSLKAWR